MTLGGTMTQDHVADWGADETQGHVTEVTI